MSMPRFKNGMQIVQSGKVSVLVFDSPETRKRTARLLLAAPSYCTRIAVAPDTTTEHEMGEALIEARKWFPRPAKRGTR